MTFMQICKRPPSCSRGVLRAVRTRPGFTWPPRVYLRVRGQEGGLWGRGGGAGKSVTRVKSKAKTTPHASRATSLEIR